MQGKKNDIDETEVEKLASRFWTKTEIAAFFDVHVDTITNNFQSFYEKGRENGKAKLRDCQIKSAMGGNVTMQIWLGKQYLGQSDKQEVETHEQDYTEIFKAMVSATSGSNVPS
jgi:hypothetical protein